MTENPAFTLLFEDDHLIAVGKEPGIVAHPCYKHPFRPTWRL